MIFAANDKIRFCVLNQKERNPLQIFTLTKFLRAYSSLKKHKRMELNTQFHQLSKSSQKSSNIAQKLKKFKKVPINVVIV